MRSSCLCLTLALLLTPATLLADSAVLEDGFEGTDFAPEGGLYYRENFEQSAGSVRFQSRITRSGQGALELSVKPLCAPDAEGCSERAEIWERTALRVPYDRGVWYAFSLRFAKPVPDDDHRYVMAQWKREIGPDAVGDFSPFLALRMRSGVNFATAETNFVAPPDDAPRPENGLCPEGWTPVWLRPETRQMRMLIARDANWTPEVTSEFDHCTDQLRVSGPGILPGAEAEWHDYAFYTRPGPDGDGLMYLVADGARVAKVEGRIGHDDTGLGANQYFKFGPYRDAGDGEWTLYYDNFRRAPDCEDALDAGLCGLIN
ncbi:polysaccharide lyase [Paracoccus sp. PAR01]|uniref:polysaccharide lyase n=1 Tax=Paracoccus sp. PAR01 TaxID=2769282 RepID=UPI00177DA244|nr:polysaccharide lyase [Paracoccus sp. PAR01]MBD9527182.1 heparin lyase I family protein [Paracoccus sp. PAR01]